MGSGRLVDITQRRGRMEDGTYVSVVSVSIRECVKRSSVRGQAASGERECEGERRRRRIMRSAEWWSSTLGDSPMLLHRIR